MGKIKDLPLLERPREKAIRYGLSNLSNAEILAIIIGSGTKNKSALDIAYEIISNANGVCNLSRMSQENLINIKGVSIVSALRILSCFELMKRVNKSIDDDACDLDSCLVKINEKYSLLLKDKIQEEMHLVCIGRKANIIKEKLLYIGTESATSVSSAEILQEALSCKSKNIVLIHNHPNGTCKPSQHDIAFTNHLAKECERFHINLYDHIIVAGSKTISMLNAVK